MPFVRGEFQAFVKAPGRYPLQVAIESHDRSQRLALADAELLVTAEGPMHANVSDDVADLEDGRAMRVLRHALRPDANSSCHVHCVSTDELDELRAEAAHQLYQSPPLQRVIRRERRRQQRRGGQWGQQGLSYCKWERECVCFACSSFHSSVCTLCTCMCQHTSDTRMCTHVR